MATRPLTLEQLIVLNDELIAIVRMGVPLELGLQGLGRELPGQLGRVIQTLQQRISSGQDLATAISDPHSGVPPAYQAIVQAGIETGQMATALQSIAKSARRVDEVRRSMRIAIFYPMIVVALAYLVFVWSVTQWAPLLISFYEHAEASTLPMFSWMLALRATAIWWAPFLPLVVLLPLALWYHRSRSASGPPLRRLRHLMHVATLTELLASMVENAVPLPRALAVAGAASGSRSIQAECQQWSEQLERGEVVSTGENASSAVPAWIVWLLLHGSNQRQLATNLRQSAESYRNDALRQSRWFIRSFPVWVTVIVGGSATLLTVVLVASPWFYVLFRLE